MLMTVREMLDLAEALPVEEPSYEPPEGSEILGELPMELRSLEALFQHCAKAYQEAECEREGLNMMSSDYLAKTVELNALRAQLNLAMMVRDHDWKNHFGISGGKERLVATKGWQVQSIYCPLDDKALMAGLMGVALAMALPAFHQR